MTAFFGVLGLISTCSFSGFRGRSRGFRRGFGDRMMDSERRGEEESAPDSQDLSSAASLDRGNELTI